MTKRNFLTQTSFVVLIILSAILLYNCGGGSGSRSDVPGLDNIPPAVSSTSPPSGAVNVPQNAKISATFSEALKEVPSQNAFIVSSTAGVVSGTLAFSGDTVTFNPSALNAQTIYNVTITTDIQDAAGNHMPAPYIWFFTTGTGIDNSPPSFAGNPWISASASSSTSIALSWNAATDNVTPADQLRYQVCRSTSPDVCKAVPFPAPAAGIEITNINTPGATTLGATGLLSNTTYYFVVRAKDQVDLMDNNTFEVSAKTGGDFVSLGGSQNAVCTGTGGLCNNDALSPSIAVIGKTLYLAWEEANNVYVRTLDTGTIDSNRPHKDVKWSTPVTPINTEGGTASKPRIVSNGALSPVPYIVYTGCNPGCKIVVKALNGAGGWDPVGIPRNSGSADESAIAFDSSTPPRPYVISTEADSSGSYYQVFVQHYDGTGWVPDGGTGPLNLNSAAVMSEGGKNPSIAVGNGTVKTAWSECTTLNCELYVRTLDSNTDTWLPASPVSLRVGDQAANTKPNRSKIAFIHDGTNNILNIAWHESPKMYIKKENSDGTFTSVGTTPDSPSISSSISFGAAATIPQVPYFVFADGTNATKLFIKRWDIGTNDWVVEGKGTLSSDGSLNMASSGATKRTIDSAMGFLQGTPYVAWTENGSCNSGVDCGKNDGTHKQLYVKRLE